MHELNRDPIIDYTITYPGVMKIHIATILVFAVILGGCMPSLCSSSIIVHDEDTAAKQGGEFLKIFYMDKDIKKAYSMFYPGPQKATISDAKKLHDTVIDALGDMTILRSDSFQPMPGQKAITVYFTGEHEKGTSYHMLYEVFNVEDDVIDAKIVHRRLSGGTWSDAQDISEVEPGTGVFAIQPYVACHEGLVHVVWTDSGEIYYTASG